MILTLDGGGTPAHTLHWFLLTVKDTEILGGAELQGSDVWYGMQGRGSKEYLAKERKWIR